MPFLSEKASERRGLIQDSPSLSNDDEDDNQFDSLPTSNKVPPPRRASSKATTTKKKKAKCCSCGGTTTTSDLSTSSRRTSRNSSDPFSWNSSEGRRSWFRTIGYLVVLVTLLVVVYRLVGKHIPDSLPARTKSSKYDPTQLIAQWGPDPGRDVVGVEEEFLGNQRVTNKILIRPKTDREGMGSQLNHIKGSMIIAKALSATFVLGDSPSHHHYSTSDMINGPIYQDEATGRPPVYVALGQTCSLSDYLPYENRAEVIRGWCSSNMADRRPMARLGYALAKRNCSIIIDDVTGRDFYNDLNGCYASALRERLGGVIDRRNTRPGGSGDAGALTVGIHVRWGDTKGDDASTEFRGSMPMHAINEIIHEAQSKFKRLDIRIAMEQHNDAVLAGFEFDYTIVDSGDVMGDMHKLADNDLLLTGSSSFAVLVHLLASEQGVTILDGLDRAQKFPGTARQFYGTFETGFTPRMLDLLPQRFPELDLVD